MKLLILSTTDPMVRRFIGDLAKEWAKNGHEVHILTPHSVKTLSYEVFEGVHIHRFHYLFREEWETLTHGDGIPENIRKFKNKLLVPFLSFSFWWNGIRLIKKHKIDIVNAHWAVPTGYIALWIKPFAEIKLVTTVYGAELFPIIAGRMKILKSFIKKALCKADVVAGISQVTVDAAKKISGREQIVVIPDGIDVDYYKPGPRNSHLLKKYNCSNKIVIFFSGYMLERKGHHHVLEAMNHIKEEIPEAKLILGGRGPLYDELQYLLNKWQLDEIVEMPGFIPEEDLVPLLQSSDVFVLPSCIDSSGDTEGSATAALEAMACGTPAVISKVGGNIGAIDDGNGAFYCKPGDPEDIAKKVKLLLSNEILRQNMGIKGRIIVEKKFGWSMIGKRYVKEFEKLLLKGKGYGV